MQSQHLYTHFNSGLTAYKEGTSGQNMDFPYSPCRMQQPTPSFFGNHQSAVPGYMTASSSPASVYNSAVSPSPDGAGVSFGTTAVAVQNAPGVNASDNQHLYYPTETGYPQYPWIKSGETHWWPTTGITAGIYTYFSIFHFACFTINPVMLFTLMIDNIG